jgi:hypothetical protein
MNPDQALREHLLNLLSGRGAHMPFEDAVANFPGEHFNTKPPNVDYTPWQLIEHLRITQLDILEYIRNPDYASPSWPVGYWPDPDAQADTAAWNGTIGAFQSDLEALKNIARDPNTDLTTPIPHAQPGHTVLREVLIVADHNSYHVGELGILRQVMKIW